MGNRGHIESARFLKQGQVRIMTMKLLSHLVLVITLTATSVVAQTKVTPPKNKYTPQQDVEIGREAAQEVRKQYPMVNDSQVRSYLERLGDRLVEAAPRELN